MFEPTRRRLLTLAGLAVGGGLAGCSEETATTQPAATPTPTRTDTPTATPTETATETPTETETETEPETETPQEDRYDNLVEAYNEELISTGTQNRVNQNWSQIRSELEEQGHDLSDPEITEEFIEDIATHGASKLDWNPDENTGAEAYAHILYNKLDINPEEILVSARTRNDQGNPTRIASILATTEENGYTKTLYQHRGDEELAKAQGNASGARPEGDNFFVLSPSETPRNTWEEAFADMWNPDNGKIFSGLSQEGIKGMTEAYEGDIESGKERTQDIIGAWNDNIIVGPNHANEAPSEYSNNAQISYTGEAFEAVGEILDPNNINENPESVGEVAHGLVSEASMFFYNNVAHSDESYMEVDFNGQIGDPVEYSAEDFEFSVVDEERKEELEHSLMDDYLSDVVS